MSAVATSLRWYYPDQVHRDSSHLNGLHLSHCGAPSSDVFMCLLKQVQVH